VSYTTWLIAQILKPIMTQIHNLETNLVFI